MYVRVGPGSERRDLAVNRDVAARLAYSYVASMKQAMLSVMWWWWWWWSPARQRWLADPPGSTGL